MTAPSQSANPSCAGSALPGEALRTRSWEEQTPALQMSRTLFETCAGAAVKADYQRQGIGLAFFLGRYRGRALLTCFPYLPGPRAGRTGNPRPGKPTGSMRRTRSWIPGPCLRRAPGWPCCGDALQAMPAARCRQSCSLPDSADRSSATTMPLLMRRRRLSVCPEAMRSAPWS